MGRTGISVIWLCVCFVVQTSFGQLECNSGYYISGTSCVRCNSNCANRECDSTNGYCTRGCYVGRYGDMCDKYCSSYTPQCRRCDRTGENCTACYQNFSPPYCTECISGHYMLTNHYCTRCRSTCVNRLCDPKTGYCTRGCKGGWYGDKCDISCSSRIPRCSRCNRTGENCTECSRHFIPPQCTECNSGYYLSGTSCVRCNSNCVNKECNSNNGYCTRGCNVGVYGDRCDFICSSAVLRCTQCDRIGENCTVCSGHFKPPQCTECVSGYYKSGTSCVGCSNCVDRLCDSKNGYCTRGCNVGWYGDMCDLKCFFQTPRCTRCDQNGGQCRKCSDHFSPPHCTVDGNKDSLVGPIVGAIVGSVIGAGLLMFISVFAVICCRRKSNGSAGKDTRIEMASAPANNLSDSAITGPHPSPPSSSTPGVEGSIYEIEDNDSDTNNGRTLQTAPPPSSSTAGDEGRHYENEIQKNIYDKLCPYANDNMNSKLYTEIDDVTTKT